VRGSDCGVDAESGHPQLSKSLDLQVVPRWRYLNLFERVGSFLTIVGVSAKFLTVLSSYITFFRSFSLRSSNSCDWDGIP
jgi:hypothetical protein